MLTQDVARLLPHMTPEERAEVNALLAVDKAARVWRPLPGPQTDAYASEADIIGYGGAAGGGKTDLMCGSALTKHKRAIIFRREAPQLLGITDRLGELLGSKDGFNSQEKVWRLPDRQLEFGSVPHAGDEKRYQGRPHDFIGFDEATNLLESQVRFLLGWLRTTEPGQRCQALLTFNPPTDAEGRWVISFFAPWLDDKHPNPARPGELRWFATVKGKDLEVPDGSPFVLIGGRRVTMFDPDEHLPEEIITPLSRTFIPSRVNDNPFLTSTGYMAQLQSLPEPLRSQMLKGDFMAGAEDDPWQVIPTLWIDQAMARWQEKDAKGPMDSLGVDVAAGGADKFTMCPRHGTWFDRVIAIEGKEITEPAVGFGRIMTVLRDRAPIHIDVVGWGAGPYALLRDNQLQVIAVNGASKAVTGKSLEGELPFFNRRAETWWRLREALGPMNPHPMALPPDPELRADLAAPRWKMAPGGGGIQVESKDDIRKRIGRSPDKGDAVVLANMSTPKRALRSPTQMAVGAAYDPFKDIM